MVYVEYEGKDIVENYLICVMMCNNCVRGLCKKICYDSYFYYLYELLMKVFYCLNGIILYMLIYLDGWRLWGVLFFVFGFKVVNKKV